MKEYACGCRKMREFEAIFNTFAFFFFGGATLLHLIRCDKI